MLWRLWGPLTWLGGLVQTHAMETLGPINCIIEGGLLLTQVQTHAMELWGLLRPGKVDSLFLISSPLVVKVAALTFIIALKH